MMDCATCLQRNNQHYASTRKKLIMAAASVGAATFGYLEARNADNEPFRNAKIHNAKIHNTKSRVQAQMQVQVHDFCIMGITVGACVGALAGLTTSNLYELADSMYTRLFSRKCTCLPAESASTEHRQPPQGTPRHQAAQIFDDQWYEPWPETAKPDASDSDGDWEQIVPDDAGVSFIENTANFRQKFLQAI